MSATSSTQPAAVLRCEANAPPVMLWIDSVGSFLVIPGDRLTIGGPALGSDGGRADLALLASLSRKHATIERHGESYLLEAHGRVRVSGRDVDGRTSLVNGSMIALGETVRLTFCQPTALSATARLDFVSDHRPERNVDGVILMDETCLLGPNGGNHVLCPDWPDDVLLFRREGELWCKSRAALFLDGEHAPEGGRLRDGTLVTGPELRFRVEMAK